MSNSEYEVMTARIARVERDLTKLLGKCCENAPDIKYGWSGSSIDVYLTGGNWQIRIMIERHIENSKMYRSVSIANNDPKKTISFYLND